MEHILFKESLLEYGRARVALMKGWFFKFIFFFLVSLASLLATDLGAPKYDSAVFNEEGWKKDRVIKGFTIYVREESDSEVLKIRAVGTLEAPLPSLMANLRDVESATDWTPDLLKKTTLDEISDLEAITYSLTAMPWPLYDRSLVLHNVLKLDKKRKLLVVHSRSVQHKDAPKSDDAVEAYMSYSYIAIRPVGLDKSYIEFIAAIDPKGSIPSWIVNFFQKKWPATFLRAMEKRSREFSPPLKPGLTKMMNDLLREMKLPTNYFEPLREASYDR